MARTLVLAGMCIAIAAGGATRWSEVASAAGPANAPRIADPKPEISGGLEGKRAWMTASYKGLNVRKTSSRLDRRTTIEFRYQEDVVSVGIDAEAKVTVTRGGRAIALTAPEALAEVQSVLGGSHAVFAARAMLSEREDRSDLKAPEMSLLASAAFLASLVGDTGAPLRLTTKFVEKHLGVYRPVRLAFGCWETYTSGATAGWNDLQNCMNEANQDGSLLYAAYRRLACNAIWIGYSESIWFEYLNCISPLAAMAQ